uniref:Aa_trans domain-containing protein n=1 Tax=Caenorhabditis tropicalis TaxID=1561998 RepID=A0A1I7TGZ0_9PELO
MAKSTESVEMSTLSSANDPSASETEAPAPQLPKSVGPVTITRRVSVFTPQGGQYEYHFGYCLLVNGTLTGLLLGLFGILISLKGVPGPILLGVSVWMGFHLSLSMYSVGGVITAMMAIVDDRKQKRNRSNWTMILAIIFGRIPTEKGEPQQP